MGIQGLLPLLKDIQHKVSLSTFHGQTVGIDAYCWLHKGAYGCAFDLVEGKDSNVYVNYIMKRINLLKSLSITPILVFDGGHLPAKAVKEDERRRNRQEQLRKGKAFLRAGNKSQAVDCFQKCVNITPAMATKVIAACRKQKVLCIVAPYEADAQLAYLQKEGVTTLTITEDSDLLIYGCTKVLFKMTSEGEGILIDLAELNRVRSMSLASFTLEKFRHMCMLSGCDYLPSIRGMGLVKSYKVMRKSSDVYRAIKSIKLDQAFKVPDGYENNFRRADAVFRFQLVFDPRSQCVVRLNDVNRDDDVSTSDLSYAGPNLPSEEAIAIALGNKDPISGTILADFKDFAVEMPDKVIGRKTEFPRTIQSDGFAFRTSQPLKQTSIACKSRKRADSTQHESEEPEISLSRIYGGSEETANALDDRFPPENEASSTSSPAQQRHINPFKKRHLPNEDETEAQGVRSRYFPLGIRSGIQPDQSGERNLIESSALVEKPTTTSLFSCLEASSNCDSDTSPHYCHEQRQALSPVDINSSPSQSSQPDAEGDIHRGCGPASSSLNLNGQAHAKVAANSMTKSCSVSHLELRHSSDKSGPQPSSLNNPTGRSVVQTHSPVFSHGKLSQSNAHIRDMLQRFARKGSGMARKNVGEGYVAENISKAGLLKRSCQSSVKHMDHSNSNSQCAESPELSGGCTGELHDSKENGIKVPTKPIPSENVAERTAGMPVPTPGRCRPVGLRVKRKAGEPLNKESNKKSTQTQITLQKFAFTRKTLSW